MKILCVHPNWELYGSDRAFASFVASLSEMVEGDNVRVVLPKEGPILRLEPFKHVRVEPRYLWVLRRTTLLHDLVGGLWKNLKAVYRAYKDIESSDLSYISTIVCMDMMLAARFIRKPVVIHIHEIPGKREIWIFRQLILWTGGSVIFNSKATRDAYMLPQRVRQHLVFNGVANGEYVAESDWDGGRQLRILLIGRISPRKGQEILIQAIGLMRPEEQRRLQVRIVGNTFGEREDFMLRLERAIRENELEGTVRLDPFEDDPTEAFRWADVVVVPSRLPESFGLVAAEAMACSRPVIASAHGGLVEIVDHRKTGLLVNPGDASALADAIRELLDSPAKVREYGRAGKQRYQEYFTTAASQRAFMDAIRQELTAAGCATSAGSPHV